jgi:hypothetical protein
MVGYEYIVAEYEPDDDVAPSRWRRWIAGAVAAATVSVATVLVLPAAGAPTRSSADIPGGRERSLTTTWTVNDTAAKTKFSMRLPSRPATKPGGSQTLATDADFARIRLSTTPSAYLTLGRLGDEATETAETALAATATQMAAGGAKGGPIRSTSVGDTPAYAADFVLASSQNVREFRWEHKGHVYSAEIFWRDPDHASLDTALAALATVSWVD